MFCISVTNIKKRQTKTSWMDNIFQWTGYTLDRILSDGDNWFTVWAILGARTAKGKAR